MTMAFVYSEREEVIEEFFKENEGMFELSSKIEKVSTFLTKFDINYPVALVTSGGTTVPLEVFIKDFVISLFDDAFPIFFFFH